MKIKGILFDCDGVILDSETIYLKALLQYLSTIQISACIDEVIHILGKPMNSIVKELRKMYGLSKYSNEQIIEGQRIIFRELFDNTKLKTMPYLETFLQECKKQGIKTAIVSSSQQKYIEEVIGRLNIEVYFDKIISGDSVQYGKPAPDIYLYAAKELKLLPEQLIVIEDSYNGIKAAKNANIYTIGYKGSAIQQNTRQADLETDSFLQITEWLKKQV